MTTSANDALPFVQHILWHSTGICKQLPFDSQTHRNRYNITQTNRAARQPPGTEMKNDDGNKIETLDSSSGQKGQPCYKLPVTALCWLWSVYFLPLKKSVHVRGYFFGVVLAFLNAFAIYEDKPNTPPIEQLNVAEGVIEFADHKSTRGGVSLVVISNNKQPQLFSCNGGKAIRRDCVPSDERNKYRGKNGRVLWFVSKGFFGKYTKLAQLEVENHIVVSYEKQKQSYDLYGFNFIFSILLLGSYLIWMPLLYLSKKSSTPNINNPNN
jgi:hypothetical protein